MALEIGKQPTIEDATEFVVWHDGKKIVNPGPNGEAPVREDGTEYDKITTYLIPMVGAVQRRIADQMMVMDQKNNRANMLTGSSLMERMIACVIHVDGIEHRGNPIRRIDQKVYDLLPSFYINAVSNRLAELNGDEEESKEHAGE